MAFAPTQVINNTKPFTSMEGLWQGYSFTQEDFQRFSGDGRSTYFHFDGNLSEHCQKFVDNVITPAQKMREKIKALHVGIDQGRDEFIWFDTIDDMKFIPECMRLPLLYQKNVRKLAEDGRIDTFGYDIAGLTKDNPWQRLIDNGVIKDVTECPLVDGKYELTFINIWKSTDPVISERDLSCIERMYTLVMEDLQRGSDISPTDRNSKIA